MLSSRSTKAQTADPRLPLFASFFLPDAKCFGEELHLFPFMEDAQRGQEGLQGQ